MEEVEGEGEVFDEDMDEEGSFRPEEEEEEETGLFPSEAMKKEQRRKEYARLLAEIESQNLVITDIKQKICCKCQKPPCSKAEKNEIKHLRCCLETENLKLRCLLMDAIKIQQQDPKEKWASIPVATTFEEDGLPLGIGNNMVKSICKESFSDDESLKLVSPCVKKQDSSDELDRLIACLSDKLCKQKSSKCGKGGGGGGGGNDEIRCLIKKLCAQKEKQSCGKKKSEKDTCQLSNICKELNRTLSMQDKLAADNASLESDRYQLQEEVMGRDRKIECLQQKINLMQCELQKLCRDKQKLMAETKSKGISPRSKQKLKGYKECVKNITKKIEHMQGQVECMKCQLNGLKGDRDKMNQLRDQSSCDYSDVEFTPKSKQQQEIKALKTNYANLMECYFQKDKELKELKEKAQASLDCPPNGPELDKAELKLLKEKISEMQDEQEEFKCLIKEQGQQVEDYRNKYLIAQQEVEEQKSTIEKLEMNNKQVEDQINMEIQRIKTKFQDKLKELAMMPKMLENEQLKLASVCKEKDSLEQKLRLVCKELKALKLQMKDDNDEDLAAKVLLLENALAVKQGEIDDLVRQKMILKDKLEKVTEELDTLRTESAKIIARLKEKCEAQRQILQSRIDKLEKELAQCRASACISITDREEIIKEMKNQLGTLGYSFDAAQSQIKTLKNHIACLGKQLAT